MEIAVTIILLILWLIFSYLAGYTEAAYWYYRNKIPYQYKLDWKEHKLWSVSRGTVLITMAIVLFYLYSYLSIIGVLGLIFMFSFTHDGSYYYNRNKIDNSYPLEWKDTSTTSTAEFTLGYRVRLSMFVIGLFWYISMILIYLGI